MEEAKKREEGRLQRLGDDRLRRLFEAFNEKHDILRLLDNCLRAQGIQIFRANGVKIPVAQRELRMLEKPPPMTISRTPPGVKPEPMDFDDNAE